MSRLARVCSSICLAVLLASLISTSVAAAERIRRAAAPEDRPTAPVSRGGGFSFTLVPLTPSVQSDPDPFDLSAPYFYFSLTNTGGDADTYDLIVENVSDPVNFFGQICIGTVCTPGSTTIDLTSGASTDSVGVQLFPLNHGWSTGDFRVRSQGNPALEMVFTVTIHAGTVFSVEPLTPNVMNDPDPFDFDAPYFYHRLTNQGGLADTYDLIVENLSDPVNFFGQICIGTICTPGSTTVSLPAGGASTDSVGVQLFPLNHGTSTGDFRVRSQTNPALVQVFTVTTYAGTAAVGVDILEKGAEGYLLEQNSPNPVRGTTSIAFALPPSERVRLDIYAVRGRAVRTLSDHVLPDRRRTVNWDGTAADGRELTSGVYFYRLTTSKGSMSKSLTLIR